MSKPLTKELILTRTKAENLESVKNLNLWGNEIDDVRILREMPNVEVLSLSVNKISSLREFRNCTKLSELYLRKNSIANLSELKYLQNLANLKVLWDNPCTEISNYRQKVLKVLPNLIKLDNQAVAPEEKNIILPSPPKKENQKPPMQEERKIRREPEISAPNNVLIAVLALIKELDENSLELVKLNIDKKLSHK